MRVEEDSNHMTSQVIVDISSNTVYNNTLRVRGREGGLYYRCKLAITDMNTSRVPQSLVLQPLKDCNYIDLVNNLSCLYKSVPQKPTSLIAIYKTSTSVSLEWVFNITLSLDYSYVVYYQSRDGVSHSVTFTTDSREDHTHELTGLPVGGIHSISLVALIDLPSPVVGPVTPGEQIYCAMHITTLWIFSC